MTSATVRPPRNARRMWTLVMISSVLASMVLPGVVRQAQASHVSPVVLTPIGTPFNTPIGIDHHEPTNQLVMSVNYASGLPYNFELVAADGSRTQFSSISGLTDEVKIATVRASSCTGGFTVGELFTGTGVPGQIARIVPDGSSFSIITLPGETGLMRGSLFQDRYCVFGGDLIVVTTAGRVWRVTSAGGSTLLASLSTHLEGVTTVPNDAAVYGPWAGKILAGAESQGRIYSIAPNGSTAFYTLGINPEDFDIVPPNENFFGVNFGGGTLMGAPASQFADKVGDVVIAQESPGQLWDVRWDNTSGSFHVTLLATVPQWEHVTFSRAGVLEIPPVRPPLDHFKFYNLVGQGDDAGGGIQSRATVTLRDQFGEMQAFLGMTKLLGNPVEKTHNGVVTPIRQPDAHLVAIDVKPQATIPHRRVEVTNQFGTEVLTVKKPDLLLVPSAKSLVPAEPGDIPDLVDHFLCYQVSWEGDGENDDADDDGKKVRARVILVDQFHTEEVEVGKAVHLCNPVEKTHGGVVTPIGSEDEHLTCYDVKNVRRQRPERRSVIVRNQFGLESLEVAQARTLCVPSVKRVLAPPPPDGD